MSPESTNSGLLEDEDGASTMREPPPDFSDHTSDSNDEEHGGDYSTRMEELFDDDGDGTETHEDDDEEDDEGGFLYTGVDAVNVATGYRDQLRDVLGTELTDEEMDAHEVERSLVLDENNRDMSSNDDAHLREDILSDNAPSISESSLGIITPLRVGSPAPNGTAIPARPFLHPNVSRLRSYTPHASWSTSNGSGGSGLTSNSHHPDGMSPSPSHFSFLSRTSSRSNLNANSTDDNQIATVAPTSHSERDVFKWTELRNISAHIYNTLSQKLSSVLGAPFLGNPTVLAANGLICVGTDQGKICVYDFKQNLKCICGGEASAKAVGSVTALALSHDHTYVASGHATGHIQLFDLKNPKTPARFVPPTTLAAVASGRKEGHIQGSRIVSVGFIAGRHTAIVSSDDCGLAFAHSLGKILFVEAPDILRILGQYQTDTQPISSHADNTSGFASNTSLPHRRKSRYTILETIPLPLGTSPHATDQYNIIAMLTPTKLVVVGLKPTPRTWFKCPREVDEGGPSRSKSKTRGTLAWYPSVLLSSAKLHDEKDRAIAGQEKSSPTTPLLVYTWGKALRLIRVDESRSKEITRNPQTGKELEIEIGRIVYEHVARWSAEDDILAVQWLNVNQIAVLTAETLQVYDIHAAKVIESVHFDGLSLASPSLSLTTDGTRSYPDSVSDVAHSLRAYKGKIFILGRNNLRVGTLLTWADRILSFVQEGDFLSAIDLTRSYYVGEAPGNRNGLPDDPALRKEIIGRKLRDLMVASARYAFSEDRMTDGTHVTVDGRGVDRTSLFEDLVAVSCRASIALEDFDFLFEELFQQYDDSAISAIYLRQLEPFILNNDIRYVPPRITQRLVALHEEDRRPDHVERIIWHIDPACLDINQAIHLCQRYHLYDALIYVYTRALRDCVAPVVELLGLIRKVQQYRRSRMDAAARGSTPENEATVEPMILNAYKIYPYLSNILSGLSYPSEEPLADDEALRAKKEVYTFLFFGRSSVWPPGEGGKLVLTADEEGGLEPTYPYVRQLLRFDSESFLHSLDIAFEDPFLNVESQGASRLVIVRILLEILACGDLPLGDATFVNIFIARNVPKYPQFLQVPPSALHSILISLAVDPDPGTREDRQLAAEYLLSAYNPHESERIVELFHSAGFYRILRSWHRHERRWELLLSAYLEDPDLRPSDIFKSVEEVVTISTRLNKGSTSPEVLATLTSALPRLLDTSLTSTAVLIDKYVPALHEEAVQHLSDDTQRFLYLRRLIGPPESDDDEDQLNSIRTGPSMNLSEHLRQLYIILQCRFHPEHLVEALKYLPRELVDWEHVLTTCETNEVYQAAIWATNWRGDALEALRKAETYQKRVTLKLVEALVEPEATSQRKTVMRRNLDSLMAIGGMGVDICLEHSRGSAEKLSLEDIWFSLLSSQINTVQTLSLSRPGSGTTHAPPSDRDNIINTLRSLVRRTFASLVSVTSTQAVSFPRLFKRLVNSAPPSMHSQYTEFRTILTSMLESYRSEGDMLVITKHLADRDLFETMVELARERDRGWSSSVTTPCVYCRKPLRSLGTDSISISKIVISRTGIVYHNSCLPLGS
ncbi:putative to vacuole [Lyophyllum shimeji]|uniref:To vacuole n=1 Tax=Lyophyllum shimeji TaxID=47721 RepID=A0A9P3PLF0_LYOSH|nr:putative to vacuole [Lyophyllum shimeji]